MNEKTLAAISRLKLAMLFDDWPEQQIAVEADIWELIKALEALPQKKAGQPRPRNLPLDALAEISGFKLTEVPPATWQMLAKALKEIHAVAPDVTPEEIKRRAAVYRQKWPERDLTGTALAKWWAACGSTRQATSVRVGENLI